MRKAIFAIGVALFLCPAGTYAQDAAPPQAVMDSWRAMARPCPDGPADANGRRDEASGTPEGYADRLCDTPSNLTGSIPISGGTTGGQTVASHISIVWDGSAYGVAWSDTRNGGYEIYFARVAADGTLLIPAVQVTNAAGARYYPSLAWTGSEYGLAWEDTRDGNLEIYFDRISPAGVVLGPQLRVTTDTTPTYDSHYPSLAWTGTEFGVAWQDARTTVMDIYFQRITAAGALNGAAVQVTTDAFSSNYPSLVWSNGEYGLAWEDNRDADINIYFSRLSSAGAKIGADIRVTADDTFDGRYPSLAWTGDGYGVAWQDYRNTNTDIYLARLDRAGAKIGSDIQVTTDPGNSYRPSLAFTGSEFGVAYNDWRNPVDDLYFNRVSTAGVVGTEVRLTSGFEARNYPALAFGTLGYGLASILSDISLVEFAGIGCHADTTPPTCPTGLTVTGNSGYGVSLTWTQGGVDPETEVAYQRIYRDGTSIGAATGSTYMDTPRPSGSPSYTVVTVNANGRESSGCAVVTAPEPEGGCGAPWTEATIVSTSISTAETPKVAWDGSAYGVVWDDVRGGSYEISFARVAPDGSILVPATRVTEDAATSSYPTIAWTGSEYGIAWQDSRTTVYDIYFARVGKDGTKLMADSQITSDVGSSTYPSLAWTGSEFGVAWQDNRTTGLDIYFARISAAGVKIGADVQITNDAGASNTPSLAWNGSEFGVAWQDNRTTGLDIYFARISAAGVKQGSDVQITSDADTSSTPSLAWNGSEYGVAWYDGRSTTTTDLYFARISAAGAKIGADVQITSEAGYSFTPSLVWTGSEYAITWHDNRSGNYDIYYASLDSSGYKIGSDRRMSTNTSGEYTASLAVGGRGLGLFWRLDAAGDQIRFIGLGCGILDTTPPSCPSSAAETGRTSASVTLAWGPGVDSESDLGHYNIYRDGSVVGATSNLSWTDSSFDPAAGYIYVVTATNAAGYESGGCASVDTADTVPPECPSGLLVAWNSATSLTFSWLPAQDAKSGLKQYKVYKNDVFLANVAAGTTSYTDATVTAGTTYSYAVLAEDYAGNLSAGCAPVSTLDTTPPTCPGNVVITWNSTTSLTLAWLPSQDSGGSGLKQYKVYRNDIFLANVAAGTASYTDATVSAGTNYSYAVLAEDNAGNLSAGCPSISTLDITPPSCPAGLMAVAASAASITLNWLPVLDIGSGLKQYKVYRNDFFLADIAAGTTTYTDVTVAVGTTYGYAVLAEDNAGNLSAGCSPISVTAATLAEDCGAPWAGPVTVFQSTGTSDNPWAAWDGSAYGVAWNDSTSGTYQIHFARVAPDGTVVVPATAITSAPGNKSLPSIAWTGTEFGISWQDFRNANYDIYFARVSSGGAVLAEAQITGDAGESASPSMVWNGSGYGVAWRDGRDGNSEIYFALISAAGAKVGSETRITNDLAYSASPSLQWDGYQYGVAWHDSRTTVNDIYFTRITAAGVKLGSDVQITSDASSSYAPSLAWNGTEYGVAWYDFRTTNQDIYFARISALAVKQGGDIQVTDHIGASYRPSVVWTGSGYAVAWDENREGGSDIYLASLDQGGTKIGSDRRLTTTGPGDYMTALAKGDRGLGLVWMKDLTGDEIAFLGLGCGALDTTPPTCPASPTETARTSTTVTLGWGPSVDSESDLGHYNIYRDGGVVGATSNLSWTDPGFDPEAGHVYIVTATNAAGYESGGCASVQTADTVPPGCPSGLLIAWNSATSLTFSWLPAQDAMSGLKQYKVYRDDLLLADVAAGTTSYADATLATGTTYSYAVLAEDYAGNLSAGCGSISAAPDPQGEPCGVPWTGASTVTTSTGSALAPSIAWDGSAYGVAWSDTRDGDSEIFFARVSSDGRVLVPPVQLTSNTTPDIEPSLAWSGSAYGLAWTGSPSGTSDIYFVTLDTAGTPLVPVLQVTPSDTFSSTSPSLAWKGTFYGLAWDDNRDTDVEIYFAQIGSDGGMYTANTRITNNSGSSYDPVLVWGDSEYGVAWRDFRDGQWEIYFARISPSTGAKVGSDLRVTNASGPSQYASLAWSGTEYGLVWEDSRTGAVRVYFTRVSSEGLEVGDDLLVDDTPGSSYRPRLVWTGGSYLTAWWNYTGVETLVQGASLSDTGIKIGNMTTLYSALALDTPVVAAGNRGQGLIFAYGGTELRFMGLGCGAPDSTPPPCPSNPAETARTPTSLTLSWGPSPETGSGFGHYAIYKDGVEYAATLDTTWTDTSFNPALGPVYHVVATNAAGFASAGCPAVDTSDHVQPSCVGGLMATVSAGNVTLNWVQAWDDKSGVKEYRVYRNGSLRATIAVGTNTFSEAVAAGSTYNYVVETADYAGNTNSSCTSCSVWVYGGTLLLFLTKNADTVNADLDWNDVGITEYVVYRSMSPQVGYEHERVPLSETRDTVLQDGVQLWFYYIQQRE